MAILKLDVTGFSDALSMFVPLMRDGVLTVSESPRLVLKLRGNTEPSIKWRGDHVLLKWFDAVIERKGKDCELLSVEIREGEILIHAKWLLNIKFDILIRCV